MEHFPFEIRYYSDINSTAPKPLHASAGNIIIIVEMESSTKCVKMIGSKEKNSVCSSHPKFPPVSMESHSIPRDDFCQKIKQLHRWSISYA